MRIITDIPLSIAEIKIALGLNAHFNDQKNISAIVTDSREVQTNDLFIPLKGKYFDGENFIEQAKFRGAYTISSQRIDSDFYVSDTALALLKIASYYKSKLPFLKKTIAITGSVGKTTLKNILFSLLKRKYAVHATKENFNNVIGMSHTILTAPSNTQYLIAELGMNHIGEISTLSLALKPDLAIITNVGTSHIGNLGSRDIIAKAKLEIIDGLSGNNLIVPMDEYLFHDIKATKFSITNSNADFFLRPILRTAYGSIFDLYTPKSCLYEQNTKLVGNSLLTAIVISSAVIEMLDINIDYLSTALPYIDSGIKRGKYVKLRNFTVFDDTYSSSPEAVISNFEYLSLIKNKNRSCVLGDMLELGNETERLHKEIGAAVYKFGFKKLYLFGSYSHFTAQGAIDAGMPSENIFVNTDITSPEITAIQIMNNYISDEIIMIKASNILKAHRITEHLISIDMENTNA